MMALNILTSVIHEPDNNIWVCIRNAWLVELLKIIRAITHTNIIKKKVFNHLIRK
jgi:hypothetical protein